MTLHLGFEEPWEEKFTVGYWLDFWAMREFGAAVLETHRAAGHRMNRKPEALRGLAI
jgi:hypothetical protein